MKQATSRYKLSEQTPRNAAKAYQVLSYDESLKNPLWSLEVLFLPQLREILRLS